MNSPHHQLSATRGKRTEASGSPLFVPMMCITGGIRRHSPPSLLLERVSMTARKYLQDPQFIRVVQLIHQKTMTQIRQAPESEATSPTSS
jgi:hypothetical protein